MIDNHTAGRGWRRELRAGAALAAIGAGAAIVEVAYAGRADAKWALPVFWVGQMLFYAAGAYAVIHRGARESSILGAVLLVAVGTYLAKVSYSPIRFTFPDELQHLRSLQDLLAHRHLFYPNPSLPVGPYFPGLEIVTDAVVTTTGLSTFVAGLVVAGVAHVMLSLAVYSLFRAIPLKAPIAGLAAMIFATEPHFSDFDAVFAYQTLALPLFGCSLLGALRLHQARDARTQIRWAAISAAAAAALLFTHHVTMLALLIVLSIFAVLAALRGSWLPTILTMAYAGGTALWFATGAHATLHYLGQPISEDLLAALPGHSTAARNLAATAAPPVGDRVLAYAGVVCTLVLLLIAWARSLRAWSSISVAARLFVVASLAYPAALAVRVLAADASELAGRALSFALIGVGAVIAPILLPQHVPNRRDTTRSRWRMVVRPPSSGLRRIAIVIVVAVLGAAAVTTGWQPWWERIPGGFKVAGYESGVDRQNLAVTTWAQTRLRPNIRFASDFDIDALLGTVGRQIAELDVATIFYAPRLTPDVWRQITSNEIRMIVIDRRMQFQRPVDGSFFAITPATPGASGPVPPAGVAKFAASPRFSQIYDSGAIVVYTLAEARVT